MKRTKKGFTLVELVIVIAVIAILAAVLIPTFSNVLADSRKAAAELEVRNAIQGYLTTMKDGEPQTLPNENGYVISYTNSRGDHYYFYYVNEVTTSFEFQAGISESTTSVTVGDDALTIDATAANVATKQVVLGEDNIKVYIVQQNP